MLIYVTTAVLARIKEAETKKKHEKHLEILKKLKKCSSVFFYTVFTFDSEKEKFQESRKNCRKKVFYLSPITF